MPLAKRGLGCQRCGLARYPLTVTRARAKGEGAEAASSTPCYNEPAVSNSGTGLLFVIRCRLNI